MENLALKMERDLPPELLAFLRRAGEIAAARGKSLYLVGGVVRDLLLGRPNLDFDLVLEGDAPSLARQLARASGEKALIHRRFGTAKFRFGNLSIDLVTARSESYQSPGALPAVKPGTIADDLLRRDFSINAMAIAIAPSSFGLLFDPHGGKIDLERKTVRILHERSFIDDATRMLRALRYEQRLEFELEENTQRLLMEHKSMLHTISGDRIRHEMELILKEEEPERILKRAEVLGVLQEIHSSLMGNGWLEGKFRLARQKAAADPDLYLSLLIYPLNEEESEALITRLNITGQKARNLRQVLRLKGELAAFSAPELAPSGIYRLLRRYPPPAIAACALACDSPIARSHLELYLRDLRYVKSFLDGEDLRRMGVEPGPRLGRMLEALLEAKLDSKVGTREEEEALVRQWIEKRRQPV